MPYIEHLGPLISFFSPQLAICFSGIDRGYNSIYHQEFQVPKMEVPKEHYVRLYFGAGFPLSRIHTAYIGEDSSILGTSKFLAKNNLTTKRL